MSPDFPMSSTVSATWKILSQCLENRWVNLVVMLPSKCMKASMLSGFVHWKEGPDEPERYRDVLYKWCIFPQGCIWAEASNTEGECFSYALVLRLWCNQLSLCLLDWVRVPTGGTQAYYLEAEWYFLLLTNEKSNSCNKEKIYTIEKLNSKTLPKHEWESVCVCRCVSVCVC